MIDDTATPEVTCRHCVATDPPARERPATTDDTARAASDAVDKVRKRPQRGPDGRFLAGNTAASHGGTLARSEALWRELADAKGELVEQLREDLAVNGSAAATFEGLLDAYAEARLMRHAMFHRLASLGGPVTGKGVARALFATYLQALDRETRLATTLGLERKARPVDPLQAVHEAVERANQ